MDSRPDAVEEVHKICGTGISFSSKPDDLDEKVVEVLREIGHKGVDGLEVHDYTFKMDPQRLPKGFFVSYDNFNWRHFYRSLTDLTAEGNCWRSHGLFFGYGIGDHASGYQCFKTTFVYHKGNHKTNWIMTVYSLIHKNSYIKADDVVLCHVFQSDSYNPRPNQIPKSVPNIFDFHEKEVDSRMLGLENLMKNPESFKDIYELDEIYSKRQANGRNGKRAGVWEHFTPIKVLGPDGEVMLTLAICHGCSIAYQTGKWDPKKGSLSNNGTKTLKEHYRKCSDHHHIAGNPQGAHHQIS